MAEASDFDWTQIDWNDLYPRLLLVAEGKLNRLIWRGTRFGPIPGGQTSHDFVQAAIEKTKQGIRIWNPEISIFQHLAGIILSDINHLANSIENQVTYCNDEKVIPIEDHRATPEASAIRRSQEEAFLAFLHAKNPKLRILAFSILHDPVRLGGLELATKLNLSICQVDSLKRALRRATEEFLKNEYGLAAGQLPTMQLEGRD
ncbi:MAG TPA: hypothetical protein VKP67_23500 [Xanthobacteraceae bacterium]|nr:hypothetical protein [Xanthobacteraceae bacterium]